MSITAQLKQWFLKRLPGMNNLVESLDLEEKWVEVAQNCRFEEKPGAVDKRAPITYLNTTTLGSGAYGVTGLTRYYTSSGVATWVAVHDTVGYVITDAGAATSIKAGLTAGKRASFASYKDLLMVSNGYDNIWVYDGSSDNVAWELGACKAVTSTTATGSLDSAATYYYAIGITVSGSEHICGAVSNSVSSGTAKAIYLSQIPLGPTGTTNRKIYRVEGGGTTLKLVDTISNNTVTIYSDTIGDGTLGANMGSVTDDMPKGAEIRMHRERLFISRDPSAPNRIYYSNPWLPHFIQQTTQLDYMDISPEDGDEISGIPIQLGTMVCIKKNTIRKLHITSATSGADPNTWYAEDPVSWNGSPAPWSITQTPYGIAFLGWDHWYMFNGASAEPIIDEFDVKDILDGRLNETVGFYHKGVLVAAYTDKAAAMNYHDRIMIYNFKREALGYDLWTSSTISGANCFAAKTGDDETGEIYYGDSQKGYVLKDKQAEDTYRLRTKTECNAGTKTSVFVGGTENSPYIEIGSETAASNIPNDVIIFWDSETTTPGTGWTEITSTYEGRLIKIGDSITTGGDSTHTHTMSASTPAISSPSDFTGDQSRNSNDLPHVHDVTCTLSSTEAFPKHARFRIFKSASCATTEFPDGAIVLWDLASAPTGWETLNLNSYYIRISATSLGVGIASHTHSVSGSVEHKAPYQAGNYSASATIAAYHHDHTYTATTDGSSLETWELDYVGLTLIKKTGESDTWDGVAQYVYCPCLSAPTGWTDVTSTYTGRYLKCQIGVPSTGSASGGSHTHTCASVTSGAVTAFEGYVNTGGGWKELAMLDHTHIVSFATSSSSTPGDPKYVTFPLYKFILGKMKTYNAAILVSATGGTWTSPALQVNAESLNKLFWNEELTGTDNALFYLKSGATSAACVASTAWSSAMSDPNGSIVSGTANIWVQYKIELTAADSTVSNPKIYFTDGYVVKLTYRAGATNAETSVNWRYEVGYRNFGEPFEDKIMKKIATVHEGLEGSFVIEWETENTSSGNTFTVALTQYPKYWDSFFPSTAMGKKVNFKFYKNDLYDFRLSEVKGLYSPQAVII